MVSNPSKFDIIIDPKQIQAEYLKDLFRYRELFYFFALRDILVRYKQTALGVVWALIRPLLNMAVFTIVFGKLAHLSSGNVNYSLFVLTGLLPWQLFASCLNDTSGSLINNAQMISKVYFPRVILPMSHILVNFVDFLISMAFLMVLFAFTGYLTQWTLVFLPILVALTVVLCIGSSLWLAAVTVRYRDFRFIIPFIIQFGMFVSPVGYGSFIIPETYRWLYYLNPMAGIIEGFRYCCFGISPPDLGLALGLSCLVNVFFLISGFRFFRKMERIFADIL